MKKLYSFFSPQSHTKLIVLVILLIYGCRTSNDPTTPDNVSKTADTYNADVVIFSKLMKDN